MPQTSCRKDEHTVANETFSLLRKTENDFPCIITCDSFENLKKYDDVDNYN